MPTAFIMPKFDMDQETATVISWIKHEGEVVQQDEPVLTVETEKVAIDVPAPATGRLVRITAREGDVVPVTTVIAFILAEGETLEHLPGPSRVGPAPLEAAAPRVAGPRPQPAASPVARRMARTHGVDLSQLSASRSRLTKADVEHLLAAPPIVADRVQATPAARRLARERGIDLRQVAGSGPAGRVQSADVVAAGGLAPLEPRSARPAEVLPLTGMRRTIAERMQTSFQEAPHIALTIEVDTSALEAVRADLNTAPEAQGSAKFTLTSLLVYLAARVLERHPGLNASLVGDSIHRWKDINVGVATSVPDGLVVPVIHHANTLSIRQVHAELLRLTRNAREGRLALRDVQEGTFSISNLGMYGIRQFRAVINPPESAVLAVGAAVRRPVVVDDQDQIAVRPMMILTLSADHRVLDGVMAAEFLSDLGRALEDPGRGLV